MVGRPLLDGTERHSRNAQQVGVSGDDLAPDFSTLAAEARRLEPRVVRVSTRASSDYTSVLIFETAWLTTQEARKLPVALKARCRWTR